MRIMEFLTGPRVIGAFFGRLAEKGVDTRSPPGAPNDADAA